MHRQNLALQRFPVGKWMRYIAKCHTHSKMRRNLKIDSLNIFVWSVALASHAACKNFGQLFAGKIDTVGLSSQIYWIFTKYSALHPRCLRRIHHGWIPHCDIHVLHTQGTECPCGLLVCVTFATQPLQELSLLPVLMNGTAQIISGFISFGTLHTHTAHFEPWQWYLSTAIFSQDSHLALFV